MAVADWNNLTSITREKVFPKVVDQITKGHPLLKKFFENAERLDGGNTIDVPVKYVHSTQGGSYSGLEVLDSSQEKTRTRARFSWRQMHQPIILANIDIAKNGGEGKVADLIRQEMEEAKTDLSDKFATDLFAAYSDGTNGVTGNSGKKIDNLIGAVDDGTNVGKYGDITRSSNTWFNAKYKTTAANLSLAGMAECVTDTTFGNERPNIIATTNDGLDAYEGLLTATMQYQTNVAARNMTGEGAFTAYTFRGIPVIADRYVPSGSMYFLNTNFLKFYTLKHPDFATTKEGFAMTDLQRPTGQDGKVGYILWYGNLICTQPRLQGRWVNISNA